MKVINAVTIGNLISAHIDKDEEKFLSYANFIAEAYEDAGEERSARIIRKRLDGSYKDEPKVSLDNLTYEGMFVPFDEVLALQRAFQEESQRLLDEIKKLSEV